MPGFLKFHVESAHMARSENPHEKIEIQKRSFYRSITWVAGKQVTHRLDVAGNIEAGSSGPEFLFLCNGSAFHLNL